MTVIRLNAIGAPAYSETLPCEERSAGRARNLVRAALNVWDLPALTEPGTLIVSELVANAVRHSGCRLVRVCITRLEPDRVRVSVSEKSKETVKPLMPRGDSEQGRGLFLVGMSADRWGVDAHRWGKSVWAELSTQVAPDSTSMGS
ncbi:serine/threonine protein phosphatase [Streptomyces nanshensis]|nr:serine/threonine protein phosphatase [Streptomyces nanshensis]